MHGSEKQAHEPRDLVGDCLLGDYSWGRGVSVARLSGAVVLLEEALLQVLCPGVCSRRRLCFCGGSSDGVRTLAIEEFRNGNLSNGAL